MLRNSLEIMNNANQDILVYKFMCIVLRNEVAHRWNATLAAKSLSDGEVVNLRKVILCPIGKVMLENANKAIHHDRKTVIRR